MNNLPPSFSDGSRRRDENHREREREDSSAAICGGGRSTSSLVRRVQVQGGSTRVKLGAFQLVRVSVEAMAVVSTATRADVRRRPASTEAVVRFWFWFSNSQQFRSRFGLEACFGSVFVLTAVRPTSQFQIRSRPVRVLVRVQFELRQNSLRHRSRCLKSNPTSWLLVHWL
ncbi:hypothetical protein Hdeb2414_s0023g00640691 [Helianthus debilis subsp. tardiflorus]